MTSSTIQAQQSIDIHDLIAHLPAFVREKQLRTEFVRVGHGTVWDWVAKKKFPAPIKLSSGVTAWKRSDLIDWANGSWKAEA